MLDAEGISELVRDVASRFVGQGRVEKVVTEDDIDSSGEAALSVTLVLSESTAGAVTRNGKVLAGILTGVRDGLVRAGDSRWPMIHYATERDLQSADED